MNLVDNKITLNNVLEFLLSNDFTNFSENNLKVQRYGIIYIPTEGLPENATYCKEYGYVVLYYDKFSDAMSQIGSLHCGGLYIAVGLFDGQRNITKAHLRNMHHSIPKGDELITF